MTQITGKILQIIPPDKRGDYIISRKADDFISDRYLIVLAPPEASVNWFIRIMDSIKCKIIYTMKYTLSLYDVCQEDSGFLIRR